METRYQSCQKESFIFFIHNPQTTTSLPFECLYQCCTNAKSEFIHVGFFSPVRNIKLNCFLAFLPKKTTFLKVSIAKKNSTLSVLGRFVCIDFTVWGRNLCEFLTIKCQISGGQQARKKMPKFFFALYILLI
jgi:hypothetical protein